jgi:hypothetical protein
MSRHPSGELKVRIACIFPEAQTLVAMPDIPVHALQRAAFLEDVSRQRQQSGQPELTENQYNDQLERGVDLFVDGQGVLIRPDPEQMDLALAADEQLQELIPKRLIKFLYLSDSRVRDSLKRRGECWRIFLPPTDPDQIRKMISEARSAIGGGAIYYYSPASGIRYLTYDNLQQLGQLDDTQLRQHIAEIATYCACRNSKGCAEIELFMADSAATAADFETLSVRPAAELRAGFAQICQKIRDAVPARFQRDDPDDPIWRNRMFSRLMTLRDDALVDEEMTGLDADFSIRVNWRPGGRIEGGELILDPACEEAEQRGHDQQMSSVVDRLILNVVQEYGDLEYINVGGVLPSPKRNKTRGGRRDVFIVQIKQRRAGEEVLQIIRMQKWGVRERLDQGKSLEDAMLETEEYTEYVLDRRLAARQLGMNLPTVQTVRKVGEQYDGSNSRYRGRRIWSPYFQRDYIPGVSTDQLSARKLANADYAAAFAELLGRAAASNMIAGRTELTGEIIFDVGDEIVVENAKGLPSAIVVSDHVGTFVDWNGPLEARASAYGACVKRRLDLVPDPGAFIGKFLSGFSEQFVRVQEDYLKHHRAFDTLFKHREHEPAGAPAHRWACVLDRLKRADPKILAQLIEGFIRR